MIFILKKMILVNRKEKTKKAYSWDWLEDANLQKERCFTFPQINPSLALLETVSSLDRKVPYLHGPSNVVVLCTTKVGTKVNFNQCFFSFARTTFKKIK